MKPVLMDIMLNGRFYCQMPCEAKGDWKIVDGEIKETYDIEKVKTYIESKLPNLKGKNYEVYFTDKKVGKY